MKIDREINIGDKLYFQKHGILTVKDRGIHHFEGPGYFGNDVKLKFSIMQDNKGEILKNMVGTPAWFWDESLQEENFKIPKV